MVLQVLPDAGEMAHRIDPQRPQPGAVADAGQLLAMEDRAPAKRRKRAEARSFDGPEGLEKTIIELEEQMHEAAEDLRFEQAARIRDELRELRRDLEGMRAT